MKVLDIVEEDLSSYKKPSMTVLFPHCTFKCNAEAGRDVCPTFLMKDIPVQDVDIYTVIDRYVNNSVSEALVIKGLEPFDDYDDLYLFLFRFTEVCSDDIVIYTGYTEEEIQDKIDEIDRMLFNNNLIVKFGRFIPDNKPVNDKVLGVTLSSSNQYAKEIRKRV